jgi:hypothetical protein
MASTVRAGTSPPPGRSMRARSAGPTRSRSAASTLFRSGAACCADGSEAATHDATSAQNAAHGRHAIADWDIWLPGFLSLLLKCSIRKDIVLLYFRTCTQREAIMVR